MHRGGAAADALPALSTAVQITGYNDNGFDFFFTSIPLFKSHHSLTGGVNPLTVILGNLG